MPLGITADELGIEIGTIVKVSRIGRGYSAITPDGVDIAGKIRSYALKAAVKANKPLRLTETKTGGTQWRTVAESEYRLVTGAAAVAASEGAINISSSATLAEGFSSESELISFIHNSIAIKPKKLIVPEIWWKFAIRSALRGGTMLVVGPSGCGKTLLANALKVALGRENKFFYVNLGGTQDPRSTLIGNTHYDKERGTYVALSYFARAIQTPGAIILLDEASRAHPEAVNILMPVLDKSQRYMRIDEKADSETIHVAEGVCFILTANVGSEYTSTRVMDRALLDRCTMFEMLPLSEDDEFANLTHTFPSVDAKILKSIAAIAAVTRNEVKSESPKVDTIISTRMTEEIASLIRDGFTMSEAAETCVYPYFSDAGGADSPRSFVRATVQKHLVADKTGQKQKGTSGSGVDFIAPWA